MDVKKIPARIAEKIEGFEAGTCWTWVAAKDRKGYGYVRLKDKNGMAHRVIYELLVGPIPKGLCIDHLCRNTSCVNPAHMEPVTNRENVLRGDGLSAHRSRQTQCKNGHDLSGDNLLVYGKIRKVRVCKTCRLKWNKHRRTKDGVTK